MRDEKEERKKQARSNKQTRQSNTEHVRIIVEVTFHYSYDYSLTTVEFATAVFYNAEGMLNFFNSTYIRHYTTVYM